MSLKVFYTVLLSLIGLLTLWVFRPQELSENEKQRKVEREIYYEYSVYLNEVRTAFARKVFEEMGLVNTGVSGGYDKKGEEIGMKFQANRRATIGEARALHLLLMEQLVEAINAHEKLRPFLAESPFTYERVTIGISFKNSFGPSADGSIYHTLNVPGLSSLRESNRNRLYYCAYDPFEEKLIDILGESYEEAVQRLAEAPIANPLIHQTTPLEEGLDEIFVPFVEEMKKGHGLLCLAIGGKIQERVDEIGVSFLVFQRATEEEARRFVVTASDQLLQAVNQSEKLKPYLEDSPFSIDRLKIHIGFRQKNHYPYFDKSVNDVRLKEGHIDYCNKRHQDGTYHSDAPPIATETYEEAKAKF